MDEIPFDRKANEFTISIIHLNEQLMIDKLFLTRVEIHMGVVSTPHFDMQPCIFG